MMLLGLLSAESAGSESASVLIMGQVDEVQPLAQCTVITVLTESGEWRLLLPSGMAPPGIGTSVVVFAHSSGSEMTIETIQYI